MAKTLIQNSAFIAFMGQIGNIQWSTKRVIRLYPYSPQYTNRVLRKMQDEGLISCKRLSRSWRYRLTRKGYEWLRESNPDRYPDRDKCMVGDADWKDHRVRRVSLVGESIAMAEMAGYSAHPDDKPEPMVLSPHLENMADRPASSAFAAALPKADSIAKRNSLINYTDYCYCSEADRRKAGEHFTDTRIYRARATPVGCYYSIGELRDLAVMEKEVIGQSSEDLDAKLKYSKISGLLFTGGGAYRVYNTEHTAPKIRVNGENAMYSLLSHFSAHVYKNSLYETINDFDGNFVRGTFLLGDGSFRAAISVIRESLRREMRREKEKKGSEAGGEGISKRNMCLADFRGGGYYFPVISEAILLYEYAIFPHWEEHLRRVVKTLFVKEQDIVLIDDYNTAASSVDGVLPGGKLLICLPALNLRRAMNTITEVDIGAPGVHVLCLDWQKPFYDLLLAEIDEDKARNITVTYMSNNVVEAAMHVDCDMHKYKGVNF